MGSICRPNFSDDFGGQLQHIAWYPCRTRTIANTRQRRHHDRLLRGLFDWVLVFATCASKRRPHSRIRRTGVVAQCINTCHRPIRLANHLANHASQHRLLLGRPLCCCRIMAQRHGRKSLPRSTTRDLQRRHNWRMGHGAVTCFQFRCTKSEWIRICRDHCITRGNSNFDFRTSNDT